jgi:hypothetical protein
MEVASTGTNADNYWYVEAAIPFASIGATTGTHVYVTYSGPTQTIHSKMRRSQTFPGHIEDEFLYE